VGPVTPVFPGTPHFREIPLDTRDAPGKLNEIATRCIETSREGEQLPHLSAGVPGGCCELSLEPRQIGIRSHTVQQRNEHPALGAERGIHGLNGNACAFRDGLDGRRSVALGHEQAARGREDGLPGPLRLLQSARRSILALDHAIFDRVRFNENKPIEPERQALSTYSLMLFLHLSSLVAAVAAASLAGFAALRLRGAQSAAEARAWGDSIRRVVVVFPVASLGLIGTGAYMTSAAWSWSTPWIVAGLAGLFMIMLLGGAGEGRRARALSAELRSAGLSQRAKRLLCDPIAWSAKVATWTLMLAVIFVMTIKPSAVVCIIALALAVVCGVLGAVPFWSERSPLQRQLSRGDAET
jgi:hypothetical protein